MARLSYATDSLLVNVMKKRVKIQYHYTRQLAHFVLHWLTISYIELKPYTGYLVC